MAVYTHFGGMRGLIAEVADEGMRLFDGAINVPASDDPVADLLVCGAAYRTFAIDRPHLYRLMFGSTSAHGIDAPARNVLTMAVDESGLQYAAFGRLVSIVHRSMVAGRITTGSADDHASVLSAAGQFWAMTHGFVMLELAGYFGGDGHAVVPVLGGMVTNLLIAMGDSTDRLTASLATSGWL